MRGINKFAALKTAIANGDEKSVKELLADQPIVEVEKSYLLDLAELNENPEIIEILKNAPVKE